MAKRRFKHGHYKLGVEAIFHAFSAAIVLKAIITHGDLLEATAAAAAVSALGRVTPTEKVDNALDKVDVSLTGDNRDRSDGESEDRSGESSE